MLTVLKKTPIGSIHTSRTLMFAELSRLMDYAIADGNYLNSLSENVTNKLTRSNQEKTAKYLKVLYGLDISKPTFKSFCFFWNIADQGQKRLLTFLYAFGRDKLLQESLDVISHARISEKVSVEKLAENVERFHPGKFTENTRRSVAQNIASSWKQAGFIEGKVKNIRVQPSIDYLVVGFALLLSYLEGDRGEFMLHSKWVKSLCLPESRTRELVLEAAQRNLLRYQSAGNVTIILFDQLLTKIGINGI